MPDRAEQLFIQLQEPAAILQLVGTSEDLHLDCKEWPAKDEDAQRVFAKAACGLSNAEGGVLVVGMKAKSVSKDLPDLIESAAPVSDARAVRSRVLDLVGQLVEPGIEGVRALEVRHGTAFKSGFVVVYIPASLGQPRRSRKDWKFYVRFGSGTLPMEYFQIADMFGKRPQPRLELFLEQRRISPAPFDPVLHRFFVLGLSNVGRGLAKFPSVRYRRTGGLTVGQFGLDGNGNSGLPTVPDEEWIIFAGGVSHVVHPGTRYRLQIFYREPRAETRERELHSSISSPLRQNFRVRDSLASACKRMFQPTELR